MRRRKPNTSTQIDFRSLPVKGIKIAVYEGVLASTPGYVHLLDCEAIGREGTKSSLGLYDKNRSTHKIKFSYKERRDPSIVVEIFNFEIDLGSHLLDAKFFGNFDVGQIRETVRRIDQCAKHVTDSIAVTAMTSEDWKLVKISSDRILRRKISKPIYYTEGGEIDLETYWLLITDTAAKNCYKDGSVVEGIILD